MKKQFLTLFSIAVACLFLMPTVAVADTWLSGDEPVTPAIEEGGEIQSTEEIRVADLPSSELTFEKFKDEIDAAFDRNEEFTYVPNPDGEAEPVAPAIPEPGEVPAGWPQGVPQPITTKSAVMTISKFTLLHDNKEIATSLDDNEDGFIAVDVTNEGRQGDIMTDVEVDFYFVDDNEESTFIERAIIELIEGNGDSETAMVPWTANMLAEQIRVIADPDGSDGGPTERIEDVTINDAEFFQILKVPYPRGSGEVGDSVDFDIKVINVGTEIDTADLKFSGEGNWDAYFEGGTRKKTISDMDSKAVEYVGFTVEIPNNAERTDMKTITITVTSDGDDERTFTVEIEVFVVHGGKRTILLVHDSGGGTPPSAYNSNTTLMAESALVEAGYEGMYKVKRANQATYTEMSQYDVVIWVGGYYGSLSTTEMGHLKNYLDDGGTAFVSGSRMIRNGGMTWYGKVPWDLYTDYFNVTFASPHSHPIRPMYGVAGDPISDSTNYEVNYVWGNHKNDAGQDWCDVLWVKENDKWAQGIFSHGNNFVGVKSWWQKETAERMPSRTVFTGIDFGQFGAYPADDANGDLEDYYDLDRADLMYQTLSWLGVTPNMATNDLGVEIADPAGDYVTPNEDFEINITVSNYGLRDWTTDFSIDLEIEGDNGYTYTDDQTLTGVTIPAKSQTLPATYNVYFTWEDGPDEDDVDYTITVTINSDDNDENQEFEKVVTGQKITDIYFVTGFREARIQYWEVGLAGTPAEIYGVWENRGSTIETFDVNIAIREPVGKEVLRNWTFEVEDLYPGRQVKITKVWTPKIAAGPMSHTQSWIRDYVEDPYLIDMGAWDVDNEATPGDNGIHSESPVDDHSGNEEQCEGIYFPVAQWAELAETELHTWDIDNSDSGANSETTWMATDIWANDPTNGIWPGVESTIAEGDIHYDDNAHARMTSQWLDMTRFKEIRYDLIYGFHTQQTQDYGAWFFRTKETAEDDPTEWMGIYTTYAYPNYDWNSSEWRGGNTGGQAGYLNNGQRVQNVDQDHNADEKWVQVRWILHSNAATSEDYESILFDGFCFFAGSDNYFTNDIGVRGLTVSPLSGDAESERSVIATVYNFGDSEAKDYKIRVLITHKDTELVEKDETISAENLDYETSKDFNLKWTPEREGEYWINATTLFEDRWGANLDEDPTNDFKTITAKAEYSFMMDDCESASPQSWWSHGTIDLDGSGDEAFDQWEYGSPDTSFEAGPKSVPSGSQAWGVVLDGNYGDFGRDGAYLQLDVDLSNARQPLLNLWQWAEVEGQGFDSVLIRAGEVTGRGEVEEWYTIWHNPEQDFELYKTDGWEPLVVPLYDEENMEYDFSFTNTQIQFVLQSDADINYAGWYIDDITIGGKQPPARDASVDVITKPVNDTAISPGTRVNVEVRVSNVGRESQNIPVRLQIEDVDGYEVFNEKKETGTLDAGRSTVMTWEWDVAATFGDIDYIVTAIAELSGDEQAFNDEKWISVRPKIVHDIGVLDLYASPWIQDINKPRKVTVELTNWGNWDEENLKVTFIARDNPNGDYYEEIHEETGISLLAGDTDTVSWDWKADKYAEYDIFATVELYDEITEEYYTDDEDPTSKDHQNEYSVLGKAITVKKILSVTVDGTPEYDGEEMPNFWSEADSDISSNDNVMGWHIDDEVGHNSETSWYASVPADQRYENLADVSLESTAIDLSEKYGSILRFYTKFNMEGGIYDNAYVYMRDNSDSDWQLVEKYPQNQPQSSEEWQTQVNGWILFEYDLDDIFDTLEMTEFQIRFSFKSDQDLQFKGVWIDDLSIYAASTENSAPFARFTGIWDSAKGVETAYSTSIIENPPNIFDGLGLTMDDNYLPRPQLGQQGGVDFDEVIAFDAMTTIDPDLENVFEDLEFEWEFGDGSTFSDDGEDGAVTTHSYSADFLDFAEYDPEAEKKYFPVTLTVSDLSGAEATDSIRVYVGNEPPKANFNIYSGDDVYTVYFNAEGKMVVDDVTNPDLKPDNSIIDVFYGDTIDVSEAAVDSEGAINPIATQWTFSEGPLVPPGHRSLKFEVGGQVIAKGTLPGGVAFVDKAPSAPVDEQLTLTVRDLVGELGSATVTFRVHPYASKTYTYEFMDEHNNELTAEATLKWRGFSEDAVTERSAWAPGKVYVGLRDVDPVQEYELGERQLPETSLDLFYRLEVYGPEQQDGKEGFESLELKLPFTQEAVAVYGRFDTLKEDVAAYQLNQYNIYGPGEDNIESLVVSEAGNYLEGSVAYSKSMFNSKDISRANDQMLYIDIGLAVKSIWTGEKLSDLELTELKLDHSGLILGKTVNISATVKNKGSIFINKPVVVRFYGTQGNTLVDYELSFVNGKPDEQTVTYAYTIDEALSDDPAVAIEHNLRVKVDADLEIDEADETNNVKEQLLPVVEYRPSVVSSFSLGFSMALLSAIVSTGFAIALFERRRRK